MLNTDKINGYEELHGLNLGAEHWAALNLEAHAFATMPKMDWSHWRITR